MEFISNKKTYISIVIHTIHVDFSSKSASWTFIWISASTSNIQIVYPVLVTCLDQQKKFFFYEIFLHQFKIKIKL